MGIGLLIFHRAGTVSDANDRRIAGFRTGHQRNPAHLGIADGRERSDFQRWHRKRLSGIQFRDKSQYRDCRKTWRIGGMNLWQKIKQPPWRTIVPGCCLLLVMWTGYLLWSPGLDVRDGRHDQARNGIWISHGWLGGDQ